MSSTTLNGNRFPRVLLVNGEALNHRSATGITLGNLFGEWPSDSLAQVYTSHVEPRSDVSQLMIKLSPANLLPLGWFGENLSDKRLAPASSANSASVTQSTTRTHIRRLLSPLLDLLPYTVPAAAMRAIAAFEPEVVYSTLGSIRIARLANLLATRLAVPLVPHFMDDWLSTYAIPGKSIGTKSNRLILRRLVHNVIDRAPISLAIGDAMAEEYQQRFNRPFISFMNPVDVPDQPRIFRDGNRIRMTYIGGLHLGRAETLRMISDALEQLDPKSSAELHLFVPASDAESAHGLSQGRARTRFMGTLEASDVAATLNSYDVAVHVESFNESVAKFTRLSVSTKIPQYFSSSIPVLAVGPATLASIRYVESSGAGISVTEPTRIFKALQSLIEQSQLRENLGNAGWHTAMERHRADRVRAAFKLALRAAATAE